jgi:hypothetical protein
MERNAETVLASTNGSNENEDAGTLPFSLEHRAGKFISNLDRRCCVTGSSSRVWYVNSTLQRVHLYFRDKKRTEPGSGVWIAGAVKVVPRIYACEGGQMKRKQQITTLGSVSLRAKFIYRTVEILALGTPLLVSRVLKDKCSLSWASSHVTRTMLSCNYQAANRVLCPWKR